MVIYFLKLASLSKGGATHPLFVFFTTVNEGNYTIYKTSTTILELGNKNLTFHSDSIYFKYKIEKNHQKKIGISMYMYHNLT